MSVDQSTVEYREIPAYPGYRVGSDGSVWSRRSINGRGPLVEKWRLMKQTVVKRGRLAVNICNGKRARMEAVHRLVLLAFVGPCPVGMECCHFPDRDPTNNRLSNLRWDTRKANAEDSIKQGVQIRGVRCARAKLTDEKVRAIRARHALGGVTYAKLGREYGIALNNIRMVVLRKTWRHVI